MNENEVLIYHYSSKNEEWYDATKNVVWFDDGGNSWLVRFRNNDELFHVSYTKMKVYSNPKQIGFIELYYKDSFCYKVKKLLLFDNKIYKIFYENGYTCVAFPNDIKVIKDTLKENKNASGVMSYYRQAVKETCESEEDQFLLSQFDDIEYVNDDSVLSLYLKGKVSKTNIKFKNPIICPFGLNLSQAKAINMVFNNRISIIEGPPGTGKTQTILNIISNAIINNMSVAVVSNNNSATDNVFEKLEKKGYSFFCAPLGNADNVDNFFEEYRSDIPSLKEKTVDIELLKELYASIPRFFEIENKKKILREKIKDVELEHKHFVVDNADYLFNSYTFKKTNVDPSIIQEAIVKIQEKEKLGFWEKALVKLKLKIKEKFFKLDKDLEVKLLQNFYYIAKKNQAINTIKELDKEMGGESLEDKMSKLTSLSKDYFNNKLAELFKDRNRSSYSKDNYKREFSAFVKDYPVVLSSTYSLAKCSKKGFLFDYLIVDESSQVNMASAILSMRIARNIIVVGDIKQLPQIDDSTFADRNKELLAKYNVPKSYSYYGNSIMSSILSLYGDSVPRQMLREHYRCAPEIINFCNKEFYDNKLIIYTQSSKESCMKVIKTVPGNFARKNPEGTGQYNQREIDEIDKLMKEQNYEDVGVITPYRYQAKLIQDKLGDKVDSSTIHKFQGREKKNVIFTSVVNDVNEFVGNENLVNVAVSRAVDNFILVTSDKVANSKSGVLSDLINYISYNQDFGSSEEGTIKSIYDILYSDYEKELAKYREIHPSKDFDTENLTKELIKEILKGKEYKSIWFRMHVSLKDFINNKSHNLTDEEYKFYKNPNAHADFLIYNKMSKKPIGVIEVDGVSFHEQKKDQKVRDEKKDSILNKAGIPLLRLKTNESNEKQRIEKFISSLLI